MHVLVTGGSGLLGRALVPRLLARGDEVTVFSRSEKHQLPLRAAYPRARFVLGDVTDADFLARVVPGHDAIVHAAALKHVDLSEREPTEYVRVNVGGSIAVARAARAAGVRRVVGVSTDKACEPYNVYGLTKLLMERAFAEHGYACVRYGNVFGSDGSVVPVWRRQLAETGTIRVTDPDMTRFFFSVDAAVDEVVWVLDERGGSAVVVVPRLRAVCLGDLATAFVRRAGHGRVEVVGPRPGEKRHESLLSAREGSFAVDVGARVVFAPRDPVRPTPVAPIQSDEAPRVPVDELVAWLDALP